MIPPASSVPTLSHSALVQLFSQGSHTLVDVRTYEAFADGHIPGSLNICVFESAFTDKMSKTVPDTETPIVLYGQSSEFKAADVAYAKLEAAGYRRVKVFRGGLREWVAESGKVDLCRKDRTSPTSEGRLSLDKENSRIRWTGRNLRNQHFGKLSFASGYLELDDDGRLAGGRVVVDMRSMTCDDLTDEDSNAGLLGHLGSIDFFAIDQHPEATFLLTSVEPIRETTPGQPNVVASGSMTVRGITRSMNLKAIFTQVEGGYVFQGQLDLNRVLFGALYGSGSLFERLGGHLVNDLVHVEVQALFTAGTSSD